MGKLQKAQEHEVSNDFINAAIMYDKVIHSRFSTSRECRDAREGITRIQDSSSALTLFSIGECYYYEVGGVEDWDENWKTALIWHQLALEKGYAKSANAIGNLYFFGRKGVNKDNEMAVKYFQKASDLGYSSEFDIECTVNRSSATELNNIAVLYYQGDGIKQDHVKYNTLLEKAVREGSAMACRNLGQNYEFGIVEKKNLVTAAMYYQKAIDSGCQCAKEDLKRILDNDEISTDDLNSIALMYREGNFFKKDYDKSKMLYEKSAEKGSALACRNIGTFYENDLVDGNNLFRRMNDFFGRANIFGRVVVRKDLLKAIEYYHRAVNKGYQNAEEDLKKLRDSGEIQPDDLNTIGMMYVNGNGIKQDYTKAQLWLKKACDAGSMIAHSNIGRLHEESKNFVTAADYYQKAFDKGYQKAEEDFWRLLNNDQCNADTLNGIGKILDQCKNTDKDHKKSKLFTAKALSINNMQKTILDSALIAEDKQISMHLDRYGYFTFVGKKIFIEKMLVLAKESGTLSDLLEAGNFYFKSFQQTLDHSNLYLTQYYYFQFILTSAEKLMPWLVANKPDRILEIINVIANEIKNYIFVMKNIKTKLAKKNNSSINIFNKLFQKLLNFSDKIESLICLLKDSLGSKSKSFFIFKIEQRKAQLSNTSIIVAMITDIKKLMSSFKGISTEDAESFFDPIFSRANQHIQEQLKFNDASSEQKNKIITKIPNQNQYDYLRLVTFTKEIQAMRSEVDLLAGLMSDSVNNVAKRSTLAYAEQAVHVAQSTQELGLFVVKNIRSLNILKSAAAGAASGAILGPIGVAVGAVIGIASALFLRKRDFKNSQRFEIISKQIQQLAKMMEVINNQISEGFKNIGSKLDGAHKDILNCFEILSKQINSLQEEVEFISKDLSEVKSDIKQIRSSIVDEFLMSFRDSQHLMLNSTIQSASRLEECLLQTENMCIYHASSETLSGACLNEIHMIAENCKNNPAYFINTLTSYVQKEFKISCTARLANPEIWLQCAESFIKFIEKYPVLLEDQSIQRISKNILEKGKAIQLWIMKVRNSQQVWQELFANYKNTLDKIINTIYLNDSINYSIQECNDNSLLDLFKQLQDTKEILKTLILLCFKQECDESLAINNCLNYLINLFSVKPDIACIMDLVNSFPTFYELILELSKRNADYCGNIKIEFALEALSVFNLLRCFNQDNKKPCILSDPADSCAKTANNSVFNSANTLFSTSTSVVKSVQKSAEAIKNTKSTCVMM
jgi:TPR repeat protein/gas vesicle protein